MEQRIVHRLWRHLPDGRGLQDPPLGLGSTRLDELSTEFELRRLAESFCPSGGPLELRRIAWWGSAFGDLARAAADMPEDAEVVVEAALFNLGVALFDRVIDDYPARAPGLARALVPQRLRRRLEHPVDPDTRLLCEEPDLALIVALFDAVLSRVGSRLRAETHRVDTLSRMLAEMYDSELGRSDPLAAKRLPLRFIGALATDTDDRVERLFESLSSFVALWDDWSDLPYDVWHDSANAFLRPVAPSPGPARLLRTSRGLVTLFAVAVSPDRISRAVEPPFGAAVESARALGASSLAKTVLILRQLLGYSGDLHAEPSFATARPAPVARAVRTS